MLFTVSLRAVSHSSPSPCTGPHTHGAKHDLLFLSGSAPLGGAPPPQRRLFVETLASCGSPLSSGPVMTEAPAGRPGQPLSRTRAETCAVPATERRSSLANGQRGSQGAHQVSRSPSPGPRTQFQNDELAPISPTNRLLTCFGREQSHHCGE